ncbi:MAG: alpha/beta hydrolase [Lachnospiraceae bacterium]
MAINKTMRKVLKALSYGEIEVEVARNIANLKKIDPLKIFYQTVDYKIYNGDYEIPIRIFFPSEEELEKKEDPRSVLLFFHGGGWVTDSVDNYERICARLARNTNQIVVSVEYRLAPEYKFPTGLEDCYAVAKAIYTNYDILNISPDDITIIGDSAGGNLAAALCLMAKDRKEFTPKRQILIYPATNNDYSENSPFQSVHDNGTDFLLTSKKMCTYLDLYQSCEEDRQNPYFTPLLAKDLSDMPKTLILTAEFDPLRDEGEAYGKRLKDAGNQTEIYRIKDALHGFFALGIKYYHVQESFDLINRFLKEE